MRNRRSLFEGNKEKLIRSLIDESLLETKEYVLARPKTLNKVKSELVSENQFPYSAKEESSIIKESNLRYNTISDLEVCLNLLEQKIDYVSTTHFNYINAFNSLINDYKQIELDANKNLLLALRDDPFSYGVIDDFTNYQHIDFLRSTINVIKDKITLGAKRIEDRDLSIKNVTTKLSSRNGTITSIDELNSTNNIYFKDGSSFKVKVETSNSSTFVELEIMIELNVETSIDKLSVVARSIENNNTESIAVSYSKDGYNYLSPELSDIERLENLTNLFDIYDTDIKYIKVRLQKRAADITTRFRNQYVFSIDYIGTIDYEFNSESVFYSKAYEIVDEDNNPINFTMATLETGTCCLTPDETSISFFLSKDGENYQPASYFKESGTVVEFLNQIDRDVFLLADESSKDLISIDSQTWKLNNYIPAGINFDKNSFVIKRNLNKWKRVSGGFYETTIDIENEEGMFFDIKETSCNVNNITRTGRFFLQKGTHTIRTNRYLDVNPRLQNETFLIEIDTFYPTNHKYIFEGYEYPTSFNGNKVYIGADRIYEKSLIKVDKIFFERNRDRRDIFYIETTDTGTYFYLNKSNVFDNEEIYIDCRIEDDNVDNKIYIKAILKSENQFKSPRIDSVQVRVI